MEMLIESVRKYPCLWRLDLPEYKDNEIKEAAWQEVFNECDFSSVLEVKNLWKKLRDGHRQAVNNKKKTTGQAASPLTAWRYEKQMEFLLPFMKNRTTKTNMEGTNQTVQNEDTSSQESSSGIIIKKPKPIYSILEEEQKRREKRAMERMQFRNQMLENAHINAAKNNTSALDKFFLCMSETTSELPEFLQMRVQRQIFNIVMEAKEQHLMQNSTGIGTGTRQRDSVTEQRNVSIVHRFSGRIPFHLQDSDSSSSSRTNSAQSFYLSPKYDLVSPAPAMPMTSPSETMVSPSQGSQSNIDVHTFMSSPTDTMIPRSQDSQRSTDIRNFMTSPSPTDTMVSPSPTQDSQHMDVRTFMRTYDFNS